MDALVGSVVRRIPNWKRKRAVYYMYLPLHPLETNSKLRLGLSIIFQRDSLLSPLPSSVLFSPTNIQKNP